MIRFFFGFIFSFFNKIFVQSFLYPGIIASIILLLLGAIFSLSGIAAFKKLQNINHSFIETQCKITEVQSTKKDMSHSQCYSGHYDAVSKKMVYSNGPCKEQTCVQYPVTYLVQNQAVTSIAKTAPFDDVCHDEIDSLKQYIPGQTYFCWYDPTNPKYVLLYRDHVTSSPYFIALGLFLILWVIYRTFISPKKPPEPIQEKTEPVYVILEDGRKVSIEPGVQLISIWMAPTLALMRLSANIGIIVGLCLLLAIPYKIHHNYQVKNSFVKTTCVIADKQLKKWPGEGEDYKSVALLSYPVKNLQYQAWATLNETYLSKYQQTQKLNQYQTGTSYFCWYDPHQPRDVFLVQPYASVFSYLGWGLFILLFSVIFRALLSKSFWKRVGISLKPKRDDISH